MSRAAHSCWSILNTLLSENEGHPPWAPASWGTNRNADKTITIKSSRPTAKEWVLEAPSMSVCVLRAGCFPPIPLRLLALSDRASVDKVDLRYKCFPEPSPSLRDTCTPGPSDKKKESLFCHLSPPQSSPFRKLVPECSVYSAASAAHNLPLLWYLLLSLTEIPKVIEELKNVLLRVICLGATGVR